MMAIFGSLAALAMLWWALLGVAAVLLLVLWLYLTAEDNKPKDKRDIARRQGWLLYWFGQDGARLWLANEAARKVSYHGRAKRVPGGYKGIVVDPTRRTDDYIYDPPWGFDHKGKYVDGEGVAPRGCDWLAAGFWEPFVRRGVSIDPVAMVREEMVMGFQRKGTPPLASPFADGDKLLRETRVEAMEIEAAGGHRAWAIGVGGARRTQWAGARERMAKWIETGVRDD